MLIKFFTLLQNVSTVIGNETEIAATGAPAADAAASATGGINTIWMLVIWVAVIGAFYFFSIRPQSKRDKQMKEMQSSIKSGDNVLTTSGFYGTIVDVGDDCFVVEFGTNRGVRIPIRKSDIVGIKSPILNPSAASSAK
jgi:preprotein translocase subunit YajC